MMAPGSMGEHVCAQGKFAKRALQTSSPSARQNHCLRPIARPELSAKDRLDPACLACVGWRQIPLCATLPFSRLGAKARRFSRARRNRRWAREGAELRDEHRAGLPNAFARLEQAIEERVSPLRQADSS